MSDNTATVAQLKKIADQFIEGRDWKQYHSPKNLSMNISLEANELMEKFLWLTTQESVAEIDKNRQEIADEVADILFSLLCFANVTGIDLSLSFESKLEKIATKYPMDKSKGKREKYDKL
jgi:dCTP diphosphatase